MKFAGAAGRFLCPSEVRRFREFAESGTFTRASWRDVGHVSNYPNAVEDHIRAIADSPIFAPARQRLVHTGLRVGIDAVNGAAADAAVRLVRTLGCEPIPIYCDRSLTALVAGFPRRPEPAPENLTELRRLVRSDHLDLGIAFDPDGDRASFVDETGVALGEEATICLAAEYVLLHRKGPVVVNLSTSRSIEDVCANHRVHLLRAPVGEAAVVERMIETAAVLGGEGNGGVILPEVNFTRDGLVAAAAVLGLIAITGSKLSSLRAALPSYRMTKLTVSVDRTQFTERRSRLRAEFAECRVDERDGLRFECPDFWVHIRPSNTEPLVRIIGETREEDRLAEVMARACKVLTT